MSRFYQLGQEAFTFDDVLLVPRYSTLQSRLDPDTSVILGGSIKLDIPLLFANMDSIGGWKLWTVIRELGGWGYLHRFMDSDDRLNLSYLKCPMTFGVSREELDLAKSCIQLGLEHICIDIAHGHSQQMLDMIKAIRDLPSGDKLTVCAGNICTGEGAVALRDAGANIIKTGIGGGSFCTTRSVTGHGYPQLSAIANVVDSLKDTPEISVIADGGIKNSGDITKSLAMGAHAVMIGKLFAGTDETSGDVIEMGDKRYKGYRGMSSRSAMIDIKKGYNEYAPEGVSGYVPYKGSVVPIIKELVAGLKSGMSYSNARNLKELRDNAVFVRVSPGTHIESSVRLD